MLLKQRKLMLYLGGKGVNLLLKEVGQLCKLAQVFPLVLSSHLCWGKILSQTPGLFAHCETHRSAPWNHGFWLRVCFCGHASLLHVSVVPCVLWEGSPGAHRQGRSWGAARTSVCCDVYEPGLQMHYGVHRPVGSTQPEFEAEVLWLHKWGCQSYNL